MPNNNDTSIGNRLGRLFQQMQLRVEYATYKAKLYAEEAKLASARGKETKAVRATISQRAYETYAKNVLDLYTDLATAIKASLTGYSDKQMNVWTSYFIFDKPVSVIAVEENVSERTVHRMIAAMKADMELKVGGCIPAEARTEKSPNWNAIDLAEFLAGGLPCSEHYYQAIADALKYGAIDVNALEFDTAFQEYLDEREKCNGGGGQ